jgi:thiol:disulfide interchange protein DsbA
MRNYFTCLYRTLLLTLLVSGAAQAQVERFIEGEHYQRLGDEALATAPERNADKVAVLEVFWYGCNHCYAFDPMLNAWVEEQGGNISFSRSPMIWNAVTKQHARLFFAAQALGVQQDLHGRIFDEIHLRRNMLADAAAMTDFFAANGVSRNDFAAALSSFGTDSLLRKTESLQRDMRVPSVPALVVNGRWLVHVTDKVPSHAAMLEVVEFLVAKEQAAARRDALTQAVKETAPRLPAAAG